VTHPYGPAAGRALARCRGARASAAPPWVAVGRCRDQV